MNAWWSALRAEGLKLKRTLAVGVALAAPLVVVLLNVLVLLQRKPTVPPPPDLWIGSMQVLMELWGFLMLPLLVALQTALVNQQDHQQGLLRVFFSLPVPRPRIYLARLTVVLLLLAFSSLVLWLGCLAQGGIMMLAKPALGFGAAPLPLLKMLRMAFAPLWGGLLLVAILYWLSHRFAGVALTLGVGISGTVVSFVLISSKFWGRLYPWSMPGRAMNLAASDHAFILLVAVLGFLLVTALGCWEVRGREVV